MSGSCSILLNTPEKTEFGLPKMWRSVLRPPPRAEGYAATAQPSDFWLLTSDF
jgi:hypothetical protein